MAFSETLTKEDKEFRDMVVARLMENVSNIWMWKSQLDAFTCRECARQDGRLFSGKQIESAYIKPPCHTNCRCTLVPFKGFV